MTQENTFKKPPQFDIYRATKEGTGAASRWSVSTKDDSSSLWIAIAKQNGNLNENGNATFDWKKWDRDSSNMAGGGINAKLGLPDIGELLLVLNGRRKTVGKDGKGLFHSFNQQSTTINFATYEKDNQVLGYTIRVANKDKEGKVNSISHSISLTEGEVLRVFLENAALKLCNW